MNVNELFAQHGEFSIFFDIDTNDGDYISKEMKITSEDEAANMQLFLDEIAKGKHALMNETLLDMCPFWEGSWDFPRPWERIVSVSAYKFLCGG